MKTQQKAMIVMAGPERAQGLDALNAELNRGWRVAQMTPMGGAGAGRDGAPLLHFAALVLLEREEKTQAEMMAQAQEEAAPLLGEIGDGDGSSADIDERGL